MPARPLAIVVVLAGSVPMAAAQTTQWSQPTVTPQWSAPAQPPRAPPPAQRGSGSGTWSAPSATRQVDPKRMEEPEPVRGGALPPRLADIWELWVPGGVWYSSDGRTVWRNHTPGAAMNMLRIAPDGSYRWGGTRGVLAEIRPWFAQPGQRYFAVATDGGNRYMARHDAAGDKLNLFFWGVGGHAASGTRR